MKSYGTRLFITVIVFVLICSTGCAQLSKEQRQTRQQSIPIREKLNANREISEQFNGKTMHIGNSSTLQRIGSEERLMIPFTNVNGVDYVVGPELAGALGFHYKWQDSDKKFLIGDNDATYVLTADSTTALRDDTSVKLPQAPVLHNAQFHIPVSDLASVLSDDISFEVQGKSMVVRAAGEAVSESMDGPDEVNTGSELDFADDPNDPYKAESTESRASLEPLEDMTALAAGVMDEAIPVLKNVDMSTLISQAKRYIGVKYEFGAAPYPQSGKFDCSTFTQYVFGKAGIRLNRTARGQASQGEAISRKNLRQGDLLFFYVPGRFKSNKMIGHVGIYMGNQQMIHASPKPKDGVQITNINKAYWKKTFLLAKRMARS